MNYRKKTVFISASSSGIGFYIAKNYLSVGYKVIINGRNISKLKKASVILKNCDYYCGDLSEERNIKKIINKIKKNQNYIDLLICSLGNSNFKKNNFNIEYALKNNLLSTTKLIENSKKILRRDQSKIICISSICGIEQIIGAPIGYSVSKAALNFYIKLMSAELAKKGITINGILPGNIIFEGSTWDKKMKNNSKKIKNYIRQNVPMNKFGKPEDIFEICRLLSESKSKFITGSLFKLDGGQTRSI